MSSFSKRCKFEVYCRFYYRIFALMCVNRKSKVNAPIDINIHIFRRNVMFSFILQFLLNIFFLLLLLISKRNDDDDDNDEHTANFFERFCRFGDTYYFVCYTIQHLTYVRIQLIETKWHET